MARRRTVGFTRRLWIAAWFVPLSAFAGPIFDTGNPTAFFTNVASALLQSDLNLSTAHIQVYPTNQYTPAAHRLLQVAANLYDSTTNRADTPSPFLPSVFRPLFRRENSNTVWIVGYREVVDAGFAYPATAPAMIDAANETERGTIPVIGTPFDPDDHNEPMVSGVPLIVGAKKGFPNFNKLALENAIRVTRTLWFRRTAPGQPITMTNQIYTLAISNAVGIQAWNSYGVVFPRPLKIVVAGEIALVLTNEYGVVLNASDGFTSNRFVIDAVTNIPAASWLPFNPQYAFKPDSFVVPLVTNSVFLTNSPYVQIGPGPGANRFRPPPVYDPNNMFRIPRWWLNVRTRLQFMLVDTNANRIVDYVNLDSSELSLNVMEQMQMTNVVSGFGDPDPGILWQPRPLGNPPGPDNPLIPTVGIVNQFRISVGDPNVSDSYWWKYNSTAVGDKNTAIDDFVQRFFPGGAENDVLSFAAPFNPARIFYQYVRWEANDPLVHYTVPDLIDSLKPVWNGQWDSNYKSPLRRLIAENPLSDHYLPWGGNPGNPAETTPPTGYNAAVKDPSMYSSDLWNFPAGEPLSFATLGRIHRGTPWQTIYLKASDVDSNTWSKWTGNTNIADAMAARPINDWHLVDLFDREINTNDLLQRLSVNSPDTNAWLQVLDGILVVTNWAPPVEVTMTSNSPQAMLIAAGVGRTRSLRPDKNFRTVGDAMSVPEWSSASPWLNTNLVEWITDDQYERIPQQLLPRLRADSIGSIARTNGQVRVQFTGYDARSYLLQVSSNLIDWVTLSTNSPANGAFDFITSPFLAPDPQFYRSALKP